MNSIKSKICIIVPGDIQLLPYLEVYNNFFKNENISYDTISWNRAPILKGDKLSSSTNSHIYSAHSLENLSLFRKTFDYLGYIYFILRILKKKKYDVVIINTLTLILFLSPFLFFKKKLKYLLDIRDYSIVHRYFKFIFSCTIKNSLYTIISSKGFISWLPHNRNYLLSHNVTMPTLEKAFNSNYNLFKTDAQQFSILTIGRIRNFNTQVDFINSLLPSSKFKLLYHGYSPYNLMLENSFSNNNNILFKGYYRKEEEHDIIRNCHFLNLYMNDSLAENTLVSNRFYLAIIFRKPIIINANSYQAELVSKYNLGLVLQDLNKVENCILEYIKNFNYVKYEVGRAEILNIILKDFDLLHQELSSLKTYV